MGSLPCGANSAAATAWRCPFVEQLPQPAQIRLAQGAGNRIHQILLADGRRLEPKQIESLLELIHGQRV
ncbi:MAG: hypothetical protein IPH08_00425 [Rhodocyclaceae bacterium]|nr:hypothetical protein [Rhodocyclaceae bacterium]